LGYNIEDYNNLDQKYLSLKDEHKKLNQKYDELLIEFDKKFKKNIFIKENYYQNIYKTIYIPMDKIKVQEHINFLNKDKQKLNKLRYYRKSFFSFIKMLNDRPYLCKNLDIISDDNEIFEDFLYIYRNFKYKGNISMYENIYQFFYDDKEFVNCGVRRCICDFYISCNCCI